MKFGLFGGKETRSLENPSVSLSDPVNWFNHGTATDIGIPVGEDAALGVPAIWQAVNLISATIGNLPLQLMSVDADGSPVKATADPLYKILHDRVNDVHTKSQFFKWWIMRALVSERGRGLALILRNKAGRCAGFLPLSEGVADIRQKVVDGKIIRTYGFNGTVYKAADILDLAPIVGADGFTALSPITSNKDAIAAMIAAERYATRMFANGGVPPLTYTMKANGSAAGGDRASSQISELLRMARAEKRVVIPVQDGNKLEPLGFEPAKQQMIELRQFQISEASRIFNVAPALLHDLSTGTYSNFEQQSLSFASQTILPLVTMIEQELNLKLFGQRNSLNYVKFNIDALVRGDLKSRMEALARAVNSGLLTPNEGRALDDRPAMEGGDRLYIQGATVPLTDAGKVAQPTVLPSSDEPTAEEPEDGADDK